MSKQISKRVLRPSKVIEAIKKRWISDKPTAADRNYSTAVAVIPEIYEENVYEDKNELIESVPKEYSEIPGPKEWPLVGNAWRFAPLIGQYKIQELDKVMWSLRREYGKIVKVGGLIGHPDLLFVFDGDLIQKVFRREEGMPHRPSMPSLHYYKQILQKEFFEGNEGVIGVHGPKWDAFRKQVQQILLPPATAKKYVEPLNAIATDFLIRMESMLDQKNELPDYFLSEIYKWALEYIQINHPVYTLEETIPEEYHALKVSEVSDNAVVRVSLNTRLGCLEPNLPRHSESQRIIDSINTFFWNVAEVELKMPVWRVYKNKSFRKYIGALEDFRTLCLKYITQSMEEMKEKKYDDIREEDISIVERILKQTGNPKLAAVLALDLLLVGVDTTSIAVASTIYQLSQNIDKQQKLFEELQAVLPNPDSKVDVVAQNNMPYLKACIKETLRMYPVIIGNGRSLQSDTILAGYKVPKGTHVIFPHLVVSNTEDYITEPEKFIPERWLKNIKLDECPVHQKKIHPFISLPFGYGRRSCLGRRFAETELYILLAKIFRKYKVNYNYGPLSYKITPTYVPEQPLRFQLTLRE